MMTAQELKELREWHKAWESQPSQGQLRKEAKARLIAKIAARRANTKRHGA